MKKRLKPLPLPPAFVRRRRAGYPMPPKEPAGDEPRRAWIRTGPTSHRGGQVHQAVPAGFNKCRVHARLTHGGDLLRGRHAPGHEQMALLELP